MEIYTVDKVCVNYATTEFNLTAAALPMMIRSLWRAKQSQSAESFSPNVFVHPESIYLSTPPSPRRNRFVVSLEVIHIYIRRIDKVLLFQMDGQGQT